MPNYMLTDLAKTSREADNLRLTVVESRWTTRLAAAVTDFILMVLIAFLPSLCVALVHVFSLQIHPDSDRAGEWLFFAAVCFFSLIYTLGEVKWGATFGKKIMALNVVSTDGEPRDLQRQIRWSVKVIPLVALFVITLIAYWGFDGHQSGTPLEDPDRFRRQIDLLIDVVAIGAVALHIGWIFFDSDHRAIHDRAAGTYVGRQVRSTRMHGFEPVLHNAPMENTDCAKNERGD